MTGTRRWILASLGLACIISVSEVQPLRVMSAPNLLRVGAVEKIFVECRDCSGQAAMDVPISVWDVPAARIQLSTTTVTLNAANKFQALGEIMVPADRFDKNNTAKQYVYLRAGFPNYLLEKKVLVSLQSGYLFIQTDKTLYTPDSTVRFRIFALTPGMRAMERDETTKQPASVTVEIVTPEGNVLPQGDKSLESGMYSKIYKLGEFVSIGQWKIVARFQNCPQHSYSAEFEVKKYVLPSFEVKLTPESSFYYYDTESFNVTVTAKYLFGEDVDGMAYVVFGVIKDNIKKAFPASLQRIPITKGNGQATLQREHISRNNSDIEQLVGRFLFVTATVHTESGSEMVEGELRHLKIVKSPYVIDFDKTPRYFKPGMSLDVTVTVTDPDGTPAEDVTVVVEPNLDGTTTANGRVSLAVDTEESDTSLIITARTNDPKLLPKQQASKSMVATPHQSNGENFIRIHGVPTDVKLGSNLIVNLEVKNNLRRSEITYLILSKGQLVKFGKRAKDGSTAIPLNIHITEKMLPSFRLIVYYHVSDQTNHTQVVSDSVWVDVENSCFGTLKLEPKSANPSYVPGKKFYLKITGNPGAKVGLVAVDKGVYVLNKKHLLTQKKVWESVEKVDTGCTPGGGKNSMGVFFDAGLMFHTDTAAGTIDRQEMKCPTPAGRKRRVASLHEAITTLAGTYQEPLQRECCQDGMKDTLLSYTCEQRSLYITERKACVDAFLKCCEELAKQRSDLKKNTLILARSNTDLDNSIKGITSRTKFDESWMWKTIRIPACTGKRGCEVEESFPLKDSITTWVVTGISFSKDHGICVGKPLDVVAFKPFFIDLRLPYSAVMEEQIEIRAILHNYLDDPINVRVDLLENVDVCSSASKRGRYTQEVKIGPKTTYAVRFVIIPMKEGKLDIEVQAHGITNLNSDGVRKSLRVVPRGVLTEVKKDFYLNLEGGTQQLTINHTIPRSEMVPRTPSSTKVFVTGRENISPLLEYVIDGSSVQSMLRQPTGCEEQRRTGMTLLVIATTYLEKTNQWEAVGLKKRTEALQHITAFFKNEKQYSNTDGSFSIWLQSQSSTWVTAYVIKVFSMANHLIEMDSEVICKAVDFLINNVKQSDGSFKEIGRCSHRMVCGSDVSLTAYCLIALQESQQFCQHSVKELPAVITSSLDYLERHLSNLTNPYEVAISSYALANANRLNKEILYNFASSERTHWEVPSEQVSSREATAYALLALVKGIFLGDARPIVRWLNKQHTVGNGYGSTQATVIVYQALSEYWTVAREPHYNLDVHLEVPGKSDAYKYQLTRDTHHTTKTSKNFDVNQNVNVTATGIGEATLTLVTQYYAFPKKTESDCTMFNLSLDFTLDKTDDLDGDVYKLNVYFSFKNKNKDASMSILDISLPTGFIPLKEDLDSLSEGFAKFIDKWEYNKDLSEKGSIVLYLPKVSHNRIEELTFRMRQTHKVGVLQPASVSIYEYYSGKEDDGTKCVKFYHPQKEDGLIQRLCRDDVCMCAQGNCAMLKKGNEEREEKVCDTTPTNQIDFVYQVIPKAVDHGMSVDIYNMSIKRVIKENDDKTAQGQIRKFLSFPHCRENLNLQLNKAYLIMGSADDTLRDASTHSFEYLLSGRTWIEWWPRGGECQVEENKPTCKGMEALVSKFKSKRCNAK